jgi:glycosyltransferase involved in cell wall biosynthesis
MEALILSSGLDTNGQNQRFVEAAKRHGRDLRRRKPIQAIAIGDYDPASVVGRFQDAAKRSDDVRIRSVHRQTHIYQGMPADIVWTRHNERDIRELAARADVWHLNNSWRPLQLLGLAPRRKPVLLHHHGSLFRSNPVGMLKHAARHYWIQAVSTIDLQTIAPDVLEWLPTAYDLDALAALRAGSNVGGGERIRIVSCPTNRAYKSTETLIRAVADLVDQGLDAELVLVEERPWAEAMAIKATADIVFDQTMFGYGCNAVEAFGMSIPVIAGAEDPGVLERMRATFGGTLPFVEAEDSVQSIQAAILRLQTKRARSTWGKRGRAHADRFHAERPALKRLVDLYRLAIETYDGERPIPELPPTRFVASVPQLYVAGRYVTFTGQTPIVVANPFVARRLRTMATRYPAYGIRELVDP